ncbi:MAG TPA: N-acetylmuramoyl-L-alanine amidase [Chthoniobacterales bacterium]|jgi:N-acetylmuramoyl-L-alanine amidase
MPRPNLHLLLAALTAAVLLGGCATPPPPPANTSHTFDTVVIDPGHGGKDSGAVRRYSPAEKTVALDVALRINRKLHESQLQTVMTRSDDIFIPLDERVAIGNATKNSIFVSIHFNDARRRGVRGFETYYHSPYAFALASAIERNLLTLPHAANRGVHVANFRVIRNARYPSVLVECGFLSNRAEGGEARESSYREELADKIAEAIVDYRYGEGMYRREPAGTFENPAGTFENPAAPATLVHGVR